MTTLEDALGSRDNNVALLRVLAAKLVVFSHSFPIAYGTGTIEPPAPLIPTSFGTIGVNVFFTISGLLITRSYVERGRLASFLWARALRIYPALIVAVVVCAFFVGPLFTSLPLTAYLEDPATRGFVSRNATLMSLTIQSVLPGVFEGNPLRYAVNDPLWTLPYELWMYAAVGALGFARALSPRPFLLVSIAALAWIARASFESGASPQVEAFARLGVYFVAGAAAYVYRRSVLLDSRWLLIGTAIAVCLHSTPLFMWAFRTLMVYAVLVLGFLPSWTAPALRLRTDLSYGIYIYGFPCQQAIAAVAPGIGPLTLCAAAMALCIPMAMASWRLIESPALRLKDLVPSAGRPAVAA